MSETPLVCPHPTCRKTITRAQPTDAAPEHCPHCGQSLDPYQTAAPPAPASSDPFQTASPSTHERPQAADTDAFQTAASAEGTEPMFVPPDDVPATLGRFQVRQKLGAGAFGVVYRAYDPQLDREVALKVAKPHAMLTKDSIKSFLREARASANLRHPNIVPVFDSGLDGEQNYIASAFIPGQTLAHAIHAAKGQGLEPRRAAQLIRQLAEALGYAHRKGVVHRDVKPANVLLDEQGDPLLADFGLARRDEGQALLSQEGTQLMGTPAYMAPEQAEGKAEAASDQYSLGCTLYELLTGRLPFAGGVVEQIDQHRTKEPPSPRSVKPALPRDLETICLKSLAKRPADRYADCQAMADDLRRWLDGEPITARRLSLAERLVRWVRKEPRLAGAMVTAAGLMLALVLGAVLFADEQGRNAQRQSELKGLADTEANRALAQAKRADDAAKDANDAARRADQAAKDATAARDAKDRQLTRAEWLVYAGQIDLAKRCWDEGNIGLAHHYLDSCRWDFRGWEHNYLYSLFIKNQQTLRGHRNWVGSVAFCPDGKRIASGSGDRTV